MAYDGGDMVRILASFNGSGGAAVAAGSVTLQIKNPLGSIATWTSASIINPTTGFYYADQLASIGGEWLYRWAGLGTNWAAAEGSFMVNTTTFIL